MHYLVAYDIADPRRLQRLAHFLERRALRCQKSVFLFHGDAGAVEALLDAAATRMELREDVLQAWKLAGDQPLLGRVRGTPLELYPSGVVLGRGQTLFVEGRSEPQEPEA